MSGDDLDGMLERMVPGSGHRSVADAEAPPFPTELDLTPQAVLARGSVGWVFQAHDAVLNRRVAVKVSRPDGGAAARQALLAEAQVTARLAHPAVLPVHDVIVSDGLLCVVFALAPTTTLAHRLADWRRDPAGAWTSEARLAVLHDIADAVARAHSLGICHGDLKPENVALDDDGRPFVLDWGGLRTDSGTFSGTPEYASPEQLRGAPASASADVYSLASMAWEWLTLRPLRPARTGEPMGRYVARHASGDAADGAPLSSLEPELARTIVAAAGPDPALRPPSTEIAAAIHGALTGRAERSRRREEARKHVAVARRELVTFHERERRVDEEKRVMSVQRAKVPPHAPPTAKRALWASAGRIAHLVDAQAATWTSALEQAVSASNLQPDDDDAHSTIAELWWERLRMAEAQGYVGERRLAEARVRRHDRGRYADLMDAEAQVSVDGPGQLRVLWVEPEGPRLVEVERGVHPLPVDRLPLQPGAWILVVERPQSAPIRLPVYLERLEHLPLNPDAMAVPQGWCRVPSGAFRAGGDEQARHPVDRCSPWLPDLLARRTCVTSAEYRAFLDALPLDEARRRAPAEDLVNGASVTLWDHADGAWRLPVDWGPDWPVVGVSLDDALAFAAHAGAGARLPSEEEWEKAARGADGRAFPWGDVFDPAFCHMRDSVAGSPRPLPVGSFATDTSPYGLVDVAGGVHEWTTSLLVGERHVVRGGSWSSDAQGCRLASRFGVPRSDKRSTVGFRLVRDP